jgi:hypothetical protein
LFERVSLFAAGRGEHPETGVPPRGVVEDLDVVEHLASKLLAVKSLDSKPGSHRPPDVLLGFLDGL